MKHLLDDLSDSITPIQPMLAAPESQLRIENWAEWCAERKEDGHRMIIYRIGKHELHVFARPTGDGRMIERTHKLPTSLTTELRKLPPCVLDGELLGGDTGTDVSRLDLIEDLKLVVFDLLQVEGTSWMGTNYLVRRQGLEEIFRRVTLDAGRVQLIESQRLTSEQDAKRFVQKIWKAGGEGAILKAQQGIYLPNKRKADIWVKIKRKESAALTIVGFEPSRGSVRFPGHPFAIVQLEDVDGNATTCKTKNDEELAKFEAEWKATFRAIPLDKVTPELARRHPALGRKLWIEFPRRTRTGGYQGPVIWDHWN